jgi:hypothetical protein
MDQPAQPGQQPEQQGRPVRALPVVVGAVLGFVATWALFVVAVLVSYARQYDGTGGVVLGAVALFGLPAVSALLMIPRSTRHWAAGLLLGVAIGSITGAGVCAGFIGLNSL